MRRPRVEAPTPCSKQRREPFARSHTRSVALACLVLLLLAACSARPPSRQRVALRAIDDTGNPLGSVRFVLGGKVVGQTNTDGRSVVEVSATGGKPLPIQVVCPPEYRRSNEPFWLRTGEVRSLDEDTRSSVNVVVCDPLLRNIAVVVSSHGVPGCPILVDGAVKGATDSSGVAHVLLQAAPESVLQVELRGPGGSEWRRSRTYRVHDGDDVLIVGEDVPVARRLRAKIARPRKIYRIQ